MHLFVLTLLGQTHNCFIYWIWWKILCSTYPFENQFLSLNTLLFAFPSLFVGFCLKYIFWFPGQIFAASPRITAILLKCETNSNNLPFLIILQPFYTSFPSHCRKLAYLEYEHNFPNIANTIVNRVNWLWILSSKQKDHDLGQKVHDCAHLLLFTHTLCMNYVITMFLLVSCMNTCNLLYLPGFVHNQPPR